MRLARFLKAKILRSLEVAEESLQGLVCIDGQIWATSSKTSFIKRFQENAIGIYASVEEVGHTLENICGIGWTGSEFMALDKATKAIYKIDPTRKMQHLFVDLMKLKSDITIPNLGAENTNIADIVAPILKAQGTNISAIAFNKGKLWITIQAGYSSSIFVIDDQTKDLINQFYAHGPDPVGITFEANGEKGWVLDGSNKQLSQFDITGNWTQAILEVPLKKPFGLALDKEGNFIVADLTTNKFHILDKGEVEW